MSFVPSGQAGERATHGEREAQLREADTRATRRESVELPAGWARKLISKLLRRRP